MTDDKQKTPAFQFYPGDWLHDVALSRCSLAAQGLWIRMLCVMHQGEPYGHLQINGVPIEPKELAKLFQTSSKLVSNLIKELLRHGVVSRSNTGLLYSRRMVRDESKRLINQQNGSRGGNPNLIKTVNPPVNTPFKPPDKASSSSSSSSRLHPNTLVVSGETTAAKIPHEELLAAYNERRGALPQARGLTDGRKKKLRARWNEHPDIDFWKSVFVKAGKSEMMLKWASFDWLMKNAENYVKTLEGNYDNDRDRKAVPRAAAPMPREKDPDPKDLPTADEVATILDRAGLKRHKRKEGLVPIAAAVSYPIESEEELPV